MSITVDATTGRGCSHDITDTMPNWVTSASVGHSPPCTDCANDLPFGTYAVIKRRMDDPCGCLITASEVCWDCACDDPLHDPPCDDPIRSDYCDMHDYGVMPLSQFEALPDWEGRA